MRDFETRYNIKQKKLEVGIAFKKKGRPPKDYVISEQDKVAEAVCADLKKIYGAVNLEDS